MSATALVPSPGLNVCASRAPAISALLILNHADTDTVTLGTGLTIQNQSIGVATQATGFSGQDGILGIGPVDLTSGTVSNTSTVPTVTDNAFSLGLIPNKQVGIAFAPATSLSDPNGELTFGGIDESKIDGPLLTVSVHLLMHISPTNT